MEWFRRAARAGYAINDAYLPAVPITTVAERSIVVNTYAEHCVMAGARAPETPELVDGEWEVTDDNGEKRDDRWVIVDSPEGIAETIRIREAGKGRYDWRLARALDDALLAAGYPSVLDEAE
jgi:hypothetical protein